MSQEIIVAVDFGSTELTAMAGTKDRNGKIHILGVEKIETAPFMQSGAIIRHSDMAGKLNNTLTLLGNRIEKSICKFYMALNARSLRTTPTAFSAKFSAKTTIEQEVLDSMQKEVLNTEVANRCVLHAYAKDFQIEGKIVQNPLSSVADQLIGNYLITTGNPEVGENIKKCTERTGFEIQEKVLPPLAESLALLTCEEQKQGCVLIDFGGGTTSVSIFKDGVLQHFAVVPFGGQQITNDICSQQIKIADAERLKIQKGVAKESPNANKNLTYELPASAANEEKQSIKSTVLSTIIESRLREILEFVKAEIEKSGLKNALLAGVVITGGTSRLAEIGTLTSEILNMNVRHGSCEHVLDKESQKYDVQEYALAIGLLLYGTVNCIENDETPKNPKKKGNFFKRVTTEIGNMFEETPM